MSGKALVRYPSMPIDVVHRLLYEDDVSAVLDDMDDMEEAFSDDLPEVPEQSHFNDC